MGPCKVLGSNRPSADECQRITLDGSHGIAQHCLLVLAGVDRRDQDQAIRAALTNVLASPKQDLERP